MLKYSKVVPTVRSNVARSEELEVKTNRGIADPLFQKLVDNKRIDVTDYIKPTFFKDIGGSISGDDSTPSRVFHGLNVSNFKEDSRLYAEQEMTLESITNVAVGNYEVVLYADSDYNAPVPEGWYFMGLDRTAATEIDGGIKNLPFIHDILNGLSTMADDNDWLLLTNVDCRVVPSIYNELNKMTCDVVEYKRQDISEDGSTFVVDWGVDGLAVRKHVWENMKSEFPDFLLGACHWDQGIHTFNIQTRQDTFLDVESLLHNAHDTTWDYFAPDMYDDHNIVELNRMYESLEVPLGFRPEFVKGPLNQPSEYAVRKPIFEDTHIVLAIWGKNKTIVNNLITVLDKLKTQTINPHIILVELLFAGEKTSFPDGIDGQHIIVNGDNENRHLFQKEALWNIGANSIPDDEYCIFADADVWTDDNDWLYKIRIKLGRHENAMVHGFTFTEDTQDPTMNLSSFVRTNTIGLNAKGVATGIAYGMSKWYYNAIGGINPFAITSNGDTLFMYEVFKNAKDTSINRFYGRDIFSHWGSMVRSVPTCHADSVYVTLKHGYHGSNASRKYILKALIVQSFKRNPMYYVELGSNGLVKWKDVKCVERKMVKNIDKFENIDELLGGYDYEL
jgi:hypothetical protein